MPFSFNLEVGAVISYRKEILNSWVLNEPSARGLATLFGEMPPLSLRGLIDRVRFVETVSVSKPIDTHDSTPLGGRATMLLRSDGSYVFSGHMRATGLFSYHFSVQVWVNVVEGTVIGAQKTGHVYGTDTPGDRQRNWSESGVNRGVLLHWRSLRRGRGLGYNLHAEIGGVLGAARDVLLFLVKGVLFRVALGPYGWFVLVGVELASMDSQLASPDILGGIVVGAGVLLIVGPFGLVPAIVLGAATVALADVRHRPMHADERAFADRVFKGTIDYDKIVLTNLSHDGGRAFTIPSVNGAILVNLDDAFDNPMSYKSKSGKDLLEPGSRFIHELTHAWQIHNRSFLGVINGLATDYGYFDSTRDRKVDNAWSRREWGTFNNEQQASIIDDWYGEFVRLVRPGGDFVYDGRGIPVTDLDSFEAINDPAFHFVRDHIRLANP